MKKKGVIDPVCVIYDNETFKVKFVRNCQISHATPD